jgi:hypothetical protein
MIRKKLDTVKHILSLRGRHLESAIFNSADMRKVDMEGAELRGAKLDFAQLQGASLSGTRLQDASLDYASLQDASLYNSQLQGANLWFGSLEGAKLGAAQLQARISITQSCKVPGSIVRNFRVLLEHIFKVLHLSKRNCKALGSMMRASGRIP